MTTHRSRDVITEGSREDVGIEQSEKSYGAADMSNAPSVEKEHGMTPSQDANASHEETTAVKNPLEKKADVAPNGGYGWVCVAACATINAYDLFLPFNPSYYVNRTTN